MSARGGLPERCAGVVRDEKPALEGPAVAELRDEVLRLHLAQGRRSPELLADRHLIGEGHKISALSKHWITDLSVNFQNNYTGKLIFFSRFAFSRTYSVERNTIFSYWQARFLNQ